MFTEIGNFSNSRLLFSRHDQNPPTPVWEDAGSVLHFNRVVASAPHSDVHVVLYQEQQSGSSLRRAVVRKFTSSSAVPDWDYVFNVDIYSHPYSSVRVTADGQRIVAAVFDMNINATRVAVFDPSSSTPIAEYSVDTFGFFQGFEVSGDGSTLVFHSDKKLAICDLDSGQIRASKYYIGQLYRGALAVSWDGSVVVNGVANLVHVWERSASNYSSHVEETFATNDYSQRVALSKDGAQLAMSLNYAANPERVSALLKDLTDGTYDVNYTQSGSGSAINLASAIELSEDGTRMALGLWGDGDGTVPEVLFFEAGNNQPTGTFDAPGSVLSMDMSPAGTQLVVGTRVGHNTVFGSGGSFWLFETGATDFSMSGVPSVGTTVEFAQDAPVGSFVRTLVSPQLATSPRVFEGVGTLMLQLENLTLLPQVSVAGQDGVARTDFALGNNPALVGTTLYFQGFGLRPRKLSGDFVQMTVLP